MRKASDMMERGGGLGRGESGVDLDVEVLFNNRGEFCCLASILAP